MNAFMEVVLFASTVVAPRPLTAVLDYASRAARYPTYAERYRAYPPDLLELGNLEAPLPPYRMGTQQAEPDTPELVTSRTAFLKAQVDKLHAVSVGLVFSHVDAITVNGDPEQRSGIFGFYDRWADFLPLGFGERPAGDPLTWTQRGPDGQTKFYYPIDSPKYGAQHRYAMSIASPGWQAYVRGVCLLLGQAGFDGTFVDNLSNEDYGPDSTRDFLAWVAEHTTPAERAAAWPAGEPAFSAVAHSPAGVLTRRFRAANLARFLGLLKAAGEAGGQPGFRIWANAAARKTAALIRGRDLRTLAPQTDYDLDEGTPWPGRRQAAGDEPRQTATVQDIFSLLRGTIPGRAPIGLLANPTASQSEDQQLLASAAAAAFGGQWVHMVTGVPAEHGWERFVEFSRAHRDLFDDLTLGGEVAVAYSWPDMLAGLEGHYLQCEMAVDALLARQVPVRLVELVDATDPELSHYKVLILPQVRCIGPETVAKLQRYAEGGGRIAAVGITGDQDELGQPLPRPALEGLPRAAVTTFSALKPEQWDQVAEALQPLLPCGSLLPDGPVGGLRIAWWRGAEQHREVVHLLNFNVPQDTPGPTPPLPAFALRLPVQHVAAARLIQPGAEPAVLTTSGATIHVPAVSVYAVVEVTTE